MTKLSINGTKAYLKENKEEFVKKLKVFSAASTSLGVAIMFPAETFAFLKTLRDAGFEAGTIGVIAAIAYYLRRDTMKVVDVRLGEFTTKVTAGIEKFTDAFTKRMDDGERRFSSLEGDNQAFKQEIVKIKTHLGLE